MANKQFPVDEMNRRIGSTRRFWQLAHSESVAGEPTSWCSFQRWWCDEDLISFYWKYFCWKLKQYSSQLTASPEVTVLDKIQVLISELDSTGNCHLTHRNVMCAQRIRTKETNRMHTYTLRQSMCGYNIEYSIVNLYVYRNLKLTRTNMKWSIQCVSFINIGRHSSSIREGKNEENIFLCFVRRMCGWTCGISV